MSLRTTLTILAVILLVGDTVSAPGGKHASRKSAKPVTKIGAKPQPVRGGGKGGVKSPAVQQKKDNGRLSLPLDILPYHYTVSIVPDLDNSTFFGEVTIDFEAERATQEIILHAAHLKIDYDKLVLTERRCEPPTPATSPSSPTSENAAPTAGPSVVSTVAAAPVSSAQETAINPGPVQTSSPTPYVEEAPAIAGEAPAPAVEEAPAPEKEEAPAVEEAPAPAAEAAPAPAAEAAPAPATEEAPAPAMEEAPSPAMEEAPAPAMEEAPVPAMEEAPAPALEEAPAPVLAMEEAPAPAVEEVPVPAMEEAPSMAEAPATEEAAPTKENYPPAGGESPAIAAEPDKTGGKFNMPQNSPDKAEELPVANEGPQESPADDAPSILDDTSVVHDEAPAMSAEAQVSGDAGITSESIIPEKAETVVSVTSPSPAEAKPQDSPTTVKDQPAETTTEKDTFNLAGEALKILEVLNRSDIPPFIKANLTDDDDMVDLAEDDGMAEQEDDKIDNYVDKMETRTDDLAIEDCQKVEVIQPPPPNYVPPPLEIEEGSEETTAGMFNSIRTAIEQLVETTLAPLVKNDEKDTIQITTSASPLMDKPDSLRIIGEKSSIGNVLIKTPEIEASTVGKMDAEVTTAGKTEAEITTAQETNNEITTVGKSEIEITTGKSGFEMTTDGKSEVEMTIGGKSDVAATASGKPGVEITTEGITDTNTQGKSEVTITTEGAANREIATDRQRDTGFTNEKTDVRSTTDAQFEAESTAAAEAQTDIVSTTYKTNPLQRGDQGFLPLSDSETTISSGKTFESATKMRESSDSPTTSSTIFETGRTVESGTEDVFSTATTETSKEDHATTIVEPKNSRKRRAAQKRKRRPTNRNKVRQSVKLPTCTSEDMYEVRVDKALSPSRKTELESPDIGVEVAKDKITQGNHNELILPTKSPLKAGKRYRLTMSFSGKMARRPVGLYRSDYVVEEGGRRKSKNVATTVFEPIHARRVFPCLDDPRFRARFSVRIAHPPHLSAYSNMPASTASDDVDSTSSNGIPPGWLWDRFETTPPMPTYLVAFFVGALARKSRTAAGAPGQNNLMVRVLARRERLRDASFALSLAPKVMMEMGQWLDRPTSLTKLDLLALPGPGPDAVENWGLVSFQERYLLTQPGLLSRFSVASVLSHELAHDWFGNLVTPHHWRYAWLSEGLATYSAARILSKVGYGAREIQPTWDVEDLSTTAAYVTSMSADDSEAIPMQPKNINNNNYRSVFSPAAYYKGYMTMRMLKGVIGDEMLTASLRHYIKQNAFGWAKSSRLWAAVNETAKEMNTTLDMPRSLTQIMASWIHEPGYPLVTITRNYTSGEVSIQQGKYRAARSPVESNATWWIPLRTWTAKTTGALLQWIPPSSKRKAVRFASPVPIAGDQWVMANAEFSGPMRVQYDVKNWDLLATALPNGNLPRGAGAQLSVDALSLASDGLLPFSVALKVVSAALESRTGDAHLTWTAAGPALRKIDRELRATKASRPYRQWLHRLLTPLDTWISFEARNDTVPDAVLARHVTTAACSLALPLCLATGRSQFRSWMASNTQEPKVPIELRGTLYCAAVRDGSSDSIWRFLWSKIATVPTDERIRILKGLGCTRDPELAKRLLQLAADVKSPVYKRQLPTIVRSIAMHESGPGVVLSFLAENIQRFSNDTKTLARLLAEVAPAVNSKKDMKKLQGLLPQTTTSRATMAKVSADATAAMERSQRLSQGIFAYFNKAKRPS